MVFLHDNRNPKWDSDKPKFAILVFSWDISVSHSSLSLWLYKFNDDLFFVFELLMLPFREMIKVSLAFKIY